MKDALLIAAACALALLSTIGAALPYPILPPLFAADAPNQLNHFLGLPPKFLFGVALLINPLGLIIGSALLGPLSDRFGRRFILLGTTLGAAAGHALTALALIIQSYPLFLLARFATGLLEGNSSVARALLADRLEGALRFKAMSWLNGAIYMGWLAGPLLAGFTLAWGVTAPFWVAVAALLGTSLLVAVALRRDTPGGHLRSWWEVARNEHAFNLLRHGELRALFALQLAYTCGVTAFYEYYPLWLVEVGGFDARGIAWVTAAVCAVMTATSVVAGRANARTPLRSAARSAFCVAFAIALVAAGDLHVGLASIALFGIPNAFYNAIIPNWCAERFGAHGQGAVMGLISTTFCFANMLMALAGSLLTLIDTRLILALGAVLAAHAGWRMLGWRQRLQTEGVT